MKNINSHFAGSRILLLITALFLTAGAPNVLAAPQGPPLGADAVPSLFAPFLAGSGAFITTSGGAPASAVNPAQAGEAHRMVFDAGYLAIPNFGNEGGYMHALSAGMLFPGRYGVFGGSMHYIGDSLFKKDAVYLDFPVKRSLGGNLFAAKEIYPGMSLGVGLNFGFGTNWTLAADFGFYYNYGTLGPLKNFTWALTMSGLGKSYYPTWLTPSGGAAFDFFRVEGDEGKKTPLVLGAAADLSFPSLFYPPYSSIIFKTGLNLCFAEIITISLSWPGASGLNVRELAGRKNERAPFQSAPSIGLGINFMLPSGGERIAGGRLPSDGDLLISSAYKPLYNGVTAIGGGVSWYVGIADKKPPVIRITYPEIDYFSPNFDGFKDDLEFPVSITDDNYVASWAFEIKDEEGNIIRTIENKEQRPDSFNFGDIFRRIVREKTHIDIPSAMIWDGISAAGEISPDGRYFFTVSATDDSGNISVSPVYETIIKTIPPEIDAVVYNNEEKMFNPRGERDSITFNLSGSEEDAWESGIYNTAGVKIKTFEPISGRPEQLIWDGRNDSGEIADDGVYSFRIGATDRAMNSASAEISNIILDARETGIFLTTSISHIAPASNQTDSLVDFAIILSLQEGISDWKLELKDQSGMGIRTFSGTDRVPSVQGWNGLDEDGQIREGVFIPELRVSYLRGDVIAATATPVTVDVSGPVMTYRSEPEYFSPDNDGVDDELFIFLTAQGATPLAGWSFEIRDPGSRNTFYRIEGRGQPAERLVWNGHGINGELVQSATDYPFIYTATDILGNSNTIEGKIGVDVLVVRDGDVLRILIPSIVFRPNFADFQSLDQDIVDNNHRIIRRIAEILNKFRDYRVTVEGHANPTRPEGSAREREEPELRRISEARARAVVDILVRNGVNRNRLSSVGVGGSRTVVPPEDRDNAWKNRRVEFILVK